MIPFRKLNLILNSKQKKGVIFLLFLILIGMVFETLGVALIIPAFTIITDPNIIDKYPVLTSLLLKFSPINLLPNYQDSISIHIQLIITAILGIIFVYFIKICFLIFLSWTQSSFITKLEIECSKKLFSGYLNSPYSFHLQKNSAILHRNVLAAPNLATTLEFSLVLVTEILVVIGIGVLLLATEPVGALVTIAIFLTSSYYFHRYTKKYLFNWGEKRHFYEAQKIKFLQQGFGAVKDLKLMGRTKNFSDRFLKYNNAGAYIARNTKVLKGLPRLWLEIMVVICLSILLFLMLMKDHSIGEIIPTLGLFAAASFRLMPSASKIVGNMGSLQHNKPFFENAYKELSNTNIKKVAEDNNNTLTFEKSIKLDKIDYTYEGTSSPTLFGVNLTIPFGSKVGFVGESGSGKSTLIDIILGVLDPTKGYVKIDDVDIQKNLRGWQNQIGYVPQTIFLTDDTLRNNVAFAISEDKMSDDLVKKAIREANLEEFVQSLPKGLDTIVGERGVRLSGGQRQRIGIARALYHQPTVLVLDEATSSLDIDTEKEIMEGIVKLKKNKTVLIIAHRLSTVSMCDELFKLSKGRIVQKGKFEEIIKLPK